MDCDPVCNCELCPRHKQLFNDWIRSQKSESSSYGKDQFYEPGDGQFSWPGAGRTKSNEKQLGHGKEKNPTIYEGVPQVQEKFEKLGLSEKLPNFKAFKAKRNHAYIQPYSLGKATKTAAKGSAELAASSSKMVQTYPDIGAWIEKPKGPSNAVVDHSEVNLDAELKKYEQQMFAKRRMTIFDFYEDQEC